jgi:ubiquinone biosynthesis protein UbiJ
MLINNIVLSLLNKILLNNQGSMALLQKFSQQSFSINIVGTFSLNAIIKDDGLLQSIDTEVYTTYINIPLSVSKYLLNNNQLDAIKDINIQGDKQLGMSILNILANLQLTNIAGYSSLTNSIVYISLTNFINTIKNTLQLIVYNTSQSISEYLQYETQDIVSKYEIEQFCNDIDELKEKTELLSKRFNLLGYKLP